MNLEIEIARLKLTSPIFNAAGTCKTPSGDLGVIDLARSELGAITVGSYTVQPRTGNRGQTYTHAVDGLGSLNAVGLTNGGQEWLRSNLPAMMRAAHDGNKALIVSVAGYKPEEYAMLTDTAFGGGADVVELNFGCPNCWSGGKQNRILSFDPDGMSLALHGVGQFLSPGRDRIFVKVSPYTDPSQLAAAAAVIKESNVVSAVVVTNTMPNCLRFGSDGKPWIRSPDVPKGFGGGAGSALLPLALGNVAQWRDLLPERISIVGVGGISSGRHIQEFMMAGATAVGVATHLLQNGPRVFGDLLAEYAESVCSVVD